MSEPTAYVSTVTVKPGEALTVWLRVREHPLLQYKVELRVREQGPNQTPIAEIFTRGDEEDYLCPHMTFDEWEPMP